MKRFAQVERKTKETQVLLKIDIDGQGKNRISTGIPFFDHMLVLFSAHGFFNLDIEAKGDLDVDFHHTVEDVGIVLGEALKQALGDKKGIRRYGYSVTPMDEALSTVAVDISNRPFLVYRIPSSPIHSSNGFNIHLAKEFFRSFSTHAGMNLHIQVNYGENEHHIIESTFKGLGRALDQATTIDQRIAAAHSTKGVL